jgi:adenylate cyclase
MLRDGDDADIEPLLRGLTGRLREGRRRLILELLERGYPLDQVRQSVSQDRLAVVMLDAVLSERASLTARDVADACDLDVTDVLHAWRLLGFGSVGEDEPVFDDHLIVAFRILRSAREAGVSEAGIDALCTLLGQHLWQLASDVLILLGNEFARTGDSEYELAHRYEDAARMLVPTAVPLVAGVLPAQLRQRMRENFVTAEEAERGVLRAIADVAVAFVDVVGFTELSQRVEAGQLQSIATRLVDAANSVIEPPVRLIKTIGDAILLMSRDTAALVDVLVKLFPIIRAQRGLPAVRAGLARGPVHIGGADAYGAPVNLASRLTDLAPTGRMWTHDAVAAACPDREWCNRGRQAIKGVHEPVTIFELRPSD